MKLKTIDGVEYIITHDLLGNEIRTKGIQWSVMRKAIDKLVKGGWL